jgi:hypothetical protein
MSPEMYEPQPSPEDIDITGLGKAAVLAALFNASAPGGLGFLQAAYGPTDLTIEQAQECIDAVRSSDPVSRETPDLYFDYLHGRPLKLELDGDYINPWGYDRDNGGEGSAKKIIDELRESGQIISDEVREKSRDNAQINANEAMYIGNSATDDLAAKLVKAVEQTVDKYNQ